jgi:hypothetical protein
MVAGVVDSFLGTTSWTQAMPAVLGRGGELGAREIVHRGSRSRLCHRFGVHVQQR